MTEFLSIGEFAKQAGLSVSAVRFYADRNLLVPAEIDQSTGYRLYVSEQVAIGQMIRDLRLIGLPLAEVRDALGLPADAVSELVDRHLRSLETDLNQAREIAASLWPSGGVVKAGRHIATGQRVSGPELVRALDQVLPFAASDQELPHLMTVLVEVRAGSIRLVATDRHRLAVRELVADVGEQPASTLIAATSIRRRLTGLASMGEVVFQHGPCGLEISDGQTEVSLAAVPAEFPNYERYLEPVERAVSVVAERAALLEAVSEFVDSAQPVSLRVSDGHLRLERNGVGVTLDVGDTMPDALVAIDPGYLADAVSWAVGPEVVIEIDNDVTSPVLFRSATDATYVCFVMPVLPT